MRLHHHLKVSFVALLFMCPLVAADTPSVDVEYYPSAASRIIVGSEEYLKNHTSLAGLHGVHVMMDYVFGSSKKNNIDLQEELRDAVRQKIEAAGLKWLTRDEMELTPGKPEMLMYPSYSGGKLADPALINDTITSLDLDPSCSAALSHSCCRNSLWVSFSQSASILRRPDSQFKLGTWGAGDDSNWCERRGEWMYGAVLSVVDQFIEDYKKAEAEKTPVKVESTDELPLNCAQAWALHMQVFDTDAVEPNAAFLPLLDKFSDQSQRCSSYIYLIETHADKRANAEYNKLLTIARAASIKEYLLSTGLSYQRLKTVAHGESKPLSEGTTDADHAMNRRVVITPILAESFSASID